MASLDRTDTLMRASALDVARVGGSVRDEILGRKVKDADYVVFGADLGEVKTALIGALDRQNYTQAQSVAPLKLRDGRQVGWRVAARGLGCIEVVLPRTEVSTGPGRHDFEIVIDPALSPAQDAVRRDFTFNALYLDIMDDQITDPTGTGRYDLMHKTINVTHPDSFRDDPLRILRALRFVSVLGFDLGPQTEALMHVHAEHVHGLTRKGVSGTAFEELCKLLMGTDVAKALRIARDTKVLETLLPELEPMLDFDQGSRYHDLTTCEHTFAALHTAARVDAPLRVRLALLFHDSGKPDVAFVGKDGRKHYYADEANGNTDHETAGERRWRKAAARLNVPNGTRSDVSRLIQHHMVTVDGKVKQTKVNRMRVEFGDDLLRDLFEHRMCDLSGKGKKVALDHIRHVAELERMRCEAQKAGVPAGLKDLKISGHDVIALGVTGRDIGRVLAAVLDEVVCQFKEHTDSREWQLARAEALA